MASRVVRRSERIRGTTCAYWLAGRCKRNPCIFLHEEISSSPSHSVYGPYARKPHSYNPKGIRKSGDRGDGKNVAKPSQKSSPAICKYWTNDTCVYGDKCLNLHSWFCGDGFSMLAKFKEHKKVITGIAHPIGSDRLYSGSTDGTVRIWDYHTGQCTDVRRHGVEVTSLICEGPWIFVGLRNLVKAYNIETNYEIILDGPKGRVLAMIADDDKLFAAAEDGVISAWKGSSESKSAFGQVASLMGHTKATVCLTIGTVCLTVGTGKMLFSGSMDNTIKLWNMDTLECKMTLDGHREVVTSLICWAYFLLSSSSDSTIKIWGVTEEGDLKVMYTHTEENGIVALSGMTDAEGKHILYCSCKDNSVRMYELPSFLERGRLFARREVKSIEFGPGGLFFTGDGTGSLMVWKWLDEPKIPSS